VDDLREIVDQNLRSRQDEARKADVIIAEGVRGYLQETRSLAAVDVVKEYRQMAEQLREQELQRALRGLDRGDDPAELLTRLSRGITNKLLHAPTTGLKQASADGRQDLLAHARGLLGLPELPAPAADSSATDDETETTAISPEDTDHSRHTLQ
jgi:glutamyl-tRNA reductase